MSKHSEDQGRTAGKPKQRTKKSRSERTSDELTTHLGSNGQGNLHLEAQEQVLQGPFEEPLSASDFDDYPIRFDHMGAHLHIPTDFGNDPIVFDQMDAHVHIPTDFGNDSIVFDHMGAQVHIPTDFDTRSTGYTLPQGSWEAPITTTQTVALSTPSAYNASTAAMAYQSNHHSPTTTVYSNPTTTTIVTLPVTTQYSLQRWVYENGHDEVTVGFLLMGNLRTSNCSLVYRSNGRT
ncbi:hypothetical protein EAE96_004145 [Botrytis aclada]|nr:hypothetical protein EAE96_004145 [Botrytis aclada]